jgi:16S rRNA (guanine966-N2)-methyltransferase
LSRSAKPTTPLSELRIIGGRWRGRKLQFPAVDGLRPTGDRLRETLFNWLMPDIQGSRVLDLFAGSGALGLEAISRGADTAILLEKQPQAAAQLLQNVALLKSTETQVIQTDALTFLGSPNPQKSFDLVFMDPPFAADLWDKTSQLLNNNQWLAEDALIYVETPKDSIWVAPVNWEIYKDKQAGQVRYRLYRKI